MTCGPGAMLRRRRRQPGTWIGQPHARVLLVMMGHRDGDRGQGRERQGARRRGDHVHARAAAPLPGPGEQHGERSRRTGWPDRVQGGARRPALAVRLDGVRHGEHKPACGAGDRHGREPGWEWQQAEASSPWSTGLRLGELPDRRPPLARVALAASDNAAEYGDDAGSGEFEPDTGVALAGRVRRRDELARHRGGRHLRLPGRQLWSWFVLTWQAMLKLLR